MAVLTLVLQALSIYCLTRFIRLLIGQLSPKGSLAKLPVPAGGSFLLGHAAKLFGGQAESQEELDAKGLVVNLGAFLGNGALLLSDPKALHHVLVKDQDIFEETAEAYATRSALFGQGLLATFGKQHRRQRKILNPVFSTQHLRGIVPIIHDIGNKLVTTLRSNLSEGQREVNIYDWMSRSSLEIIAQSGFGHSFNSFEEGQKEHPYRLAVRQLPSLLFRTAIPQMMFLPFVFRWNLGGRSLQRWFLSNLTWGSIRALKKVVDTMDSTAREIHGVRKKALETGSIPDMSRKDILTILMRSNKEMDEEDRLPDEEIIAQITTLVFAGTDTTAGTLCRLLWILAEDQDAQNRLREEIREAKRRYGEVGYDQIFALPYLDAVCRETLRLYPTVPVMTRTTLKDTVVPLHRPVRGIDGKDLTELVIPKGTMIAVSISGCNRSSLWGLDSLQWRPERWQMEVPKDLIEAKVPGIYSHLLTFLGGSRACIGFKFAQLAIKVLLFHLVSNFNFKLTDKQIRWQSLGVVSPYADKDKQQPEFPIVVNIADP